VILLDTNVVSEAMTRAPDPRVREWLDAQAAETLFLSSVTEAELRFGVGALPAGKRKATLAAALGDVLGLFAGRILPFDTEAARRYADLAVKARAAGRGFPCPTAISRRSPPRVGSPSRRATRALSTPRA
jgi:predicted nucleic acid-binding protein